MIALVRIALTRPYTFVVLALLLLIVGPLAALRTPTDIFPDIRIPVIGVVWQYTGLPPDQMAGRITTQFERSLTTTVNDIEHIVANSYAGFGIVKIFFQPNVDIRTANAQVTAISQTLLKQLPPGATPPLILNYSASTVPIINLALSGDGLTEQNLADIGINQLRTPLVTVPGVAIPFPFGGKQRQIQIDLDPNALQARGLSGQDVANALAAQNLITPVGTQKIGGFEYTINLNNSPLRIPELGRLPIRSVNGELLRLIVYSKPPIFCVPTGVMRFCAASALATSWPERPRACSAFGSRSIWIWRCLPAERKRNRHAGHGHQRRAQLVDADVGKVLLGQAVARQRGD